MATTLLYLVPLTLGLTEEKQMISMVLYENYYDSYVCIYVCACVRAYVCMCLRAYVCMYVCIVLYCMGVSMYACIM